MNRAKSPNETSQRRKKVRFCTLYGDCCNGTVDIGAKDTETFARLMNLSSKIEPICNNLCANINATYGNISVMVDS